MNKQDFLTQLQTRIRVLEDSEQRDILDEYAQHIDLQMREGFSEEAAIGDFGDLDALAAEILEAYHVNPTYAEPPRAGSGGTVVSVPDPRPALKRFGGAIAACFRRTGGEIGRFFRWLGGGAARFFHWIGGGFSQLFHSFDQQANAVPEQVWEEKRPKKEKKERTMEQASAVQSVDGALRRGGRGLWRGIRALLRLIWNLALILVTVPFALAGILSLVCIGALVVLLVQGYPLAGPTLCCVGLALCATAVVVLLAGLLRRRNQTAQAPDQPEGPLAPLGEIEELEVYHE